MKKFKPSMTFFRSMLKLKIKRKLSIAFIGFSVLPILILGILAWHINSQSIQESTIQELSHLSEVINIRLRDFTEEVRKDQLFMIRGFQGIGEPQMFKSLEMSGLKRRAYDLMLTRKPYAGITFLADTLKKAVFSIRRRESKPNSVEFYNSLYSWYYYKVLMEGLSEEQMRITPVQQMDPVNGETLAAFSFAMPIQTDSNKIQGILVIDVFADKIFSIIETSLDKTQDFIAGIVDKDGRFLYHSEKKQDWNRLIAEALIQNLYSDFSESISQEILSFTAGEYVTEKGDVIYHLPMALGTMGFQQNYFLYLVRPGYIVFAPVRTFGIISIALAGVFIILAYVLSRIATQRFVTPIQRLQEGSDILAMGDFSHRIYLNTGDEIEQLANKFNYMARSINERDSKLNDYSTQLENRVAARTQELLDEKNKLSTIFNNIPGTLMLIDQDQTILAASTKIEQITKLSSDEVIGKKCCDVINIPNVCDNCSIINTNGNPGTYRQEFQIIDENDIEKTFEVYDIPIKLYSGKKAYLKILSDITHRIELQNQLLQSEKLASTGEMAAVIAHEIRNLLTSINMLLQLLQESDSLEASDKESLDVVLNATSRINKFTEDLLSFARPTTLNKQPIKFIDLIHECMKLYQHQFKSHNIHTELDIQKNLPRIQIDYTLMSEAVSNVLLNTYQALGNKGNVKISVQYFKTRNDFKKSVNISEIKQSMQNVINLEWANGIIMLTVIDDGPGIPKENLLKIFDPFFTTKINGTGLGLSMARRVVETHKGVIFASSEESQGTKITMIIPSGI